MCLLLILYLVMSYRFDYDTLMESLLKTRSLLTLKHTSSSLILRQVQYLLGKFKYVGLSFYLFFNKMGHLIKIILQQFFQHLIND